MGAGSALLKGYNSERAFFKKASVKKRKNKLSDREIRELKELLGEY